MASLINAWVLCGGEGRRMGGQDKGLLTWREHALAWHVATALAPQVGHLALNANRHLDHYRQWTWPVIPDDPDLPPLCGPLIGVLTGLRHGQTPWLQLAPCDGPTLPGDLVARLRQATQGGDIDIAVPQTIDEHTGETRHHWTTALIARHLRTSLEDAVLGGERRVHRWMTQQRWIGVCFEAAADFANINTPETLHGHS